MRYHKVYVKFMGELGSVDVLSKKLIYIFQLDNLKHDFFNRNSGKDYR